MAKIYRKIQYLHKNIGYFPELYPYVNHGFSWGKNAGNMQFSSGDVVSVRQNVQGFLEKMEMGDIKDTFNMIPEHKDSIVILDNTLQRTLPRRRFGKPIKCDAIITELPQVTLTVKVGDCTTTIIFARLKGGKDVISIVHTGRRSAEINLPKKVITTIHKKYNCDKYKIFIGIIPHLFKRNRKFEHIQNIKNKTIWKGFIEKKNGYYYIDETGLVLSQYKEAGIPSKNISVYHVDTFKAAQDGKTFSYKYHLEMQKRGKQVPEGRFIAAVRKWDS
jgi:copper oxidase (laccase) domain-containing protein